MEKFVRDKDPGSATLLKINEIILKAVKNFILGFFPKNH
jgi:hypothetical protein